ncbi:hypothetical protein FRC11_013209 [Ceratobasidium sp. 423]|nr:hypothetical protein FRC11_013209 [Ceratobasidium sp. 423]
MYRHCPTPDGVNQRTRACFLSSKYWASILHPDLVTLGPMLNKMFVSVRPEWAYRPELNPERVHEALMRLLPTEILRVDTSGEDMTIIIGGRKIPAPPGNMWSYLPNPHEDWGR